MPLCHWPCSCYPNHYLGQIHDWMNDLYPRWVAAHGVMIVSPVHWYQATSPLKLMMDRLVCADGGNPDPTTTHGKTPEEAKAIELKGWDYPKHLKGRIFSVIAHGDAVGAERVCAALTDWFMDLELVSAGAMALLDRYIGYYEPYATSHEALDKDEAFMEETPERRPHSSRSRYRDASGSARTRQHLGSAARKVSNGPSSRPHRFLLFTS